MFQYNLRRLSDFFLGVLAVCAAFVLITVIAKFTILLLQDDPLAPTCRSDAAVVCSDDEQFLEQFESKNCKLDKVYIQTEEGRILTNCASVQCYFPHDVTKPY